MKDFSSVGRTSPSASCLPSPSLASEVCEPPGVELPTGLPNLIQRLRAAGADARHGGQRGQADLFCEVADAMASMVETNRILNRRVQDIESGLAREEIGRKLVSMRRDMLHYRSNSEGAFRRMCSAHDEIKRIAQEILRATEAAPPKHWHSTSDVRVGGLPTPPGSVWANFSTQGGEWKSVRPADEIGPLIDELIALRKRVGARRGRPSAIARLEGSQTRPASDGEARQTAEPAAGDRTQNTPSESR